MVNYTVTISFEKESHCLECPLRDAIEDDSCRLQEEKDYGTWESQMANCPLIKDKNFSEILEQELTS